MSKTLRNMDFVAEFSLFNSIAIPPAFILLAALRRPAMSLVESAAHTMATVQAILATSSATLPFLGLFFALDPQQVLSSWSSG